VKFLASLEDESSERSHDEILAKPGALKTFRRRQMRLRKFVVCGRLGAAGTLAHALKRGAQRMAGPQCRTPALSRLGAVVSASASRLTADAPCKQAGYI